MFSYIICVAALMESFPSGASQGYLKKLGNDYPERMNVCQRVYETAEKHEIEPEILVSIAYQETAMRGWLVGGAGEKGPLQVIPKYSSKKCKKNFKKCDWISEGAMIFKRWLAIKKSLPKALIHYNAGNISNRKARAYSRKIMKRIYKLRLIMKHASLQTKSQLLH